MSNNVVPLRAFQKNQSDIEKTLSRLKGGSGDGTSGGMDGWQTSVEKRLDSLDGRMKNVETGVADLRVDTAAIKENVRHLPTKPWMFSTLAAMIVAIGALVALIVRFVPPAG